MNGKHVTQQRQVERMRPALNPKSWLTVINHLHLLRMHELQCSSEGNPEGAFFSYALHEWQKPLTSMFSI